MPKFQIILRGIISRLETCVCQYHISNYSRDVLAPLIGWSSGQLPYCPVLFSPAVAVRSVVSVLSIIFVTVYVSGGGT